ncbi:hypothetical protein C8F01DRAFT_1112537 [Mycena amicta]|nr:hypothetical protein C8F01DRAFT_1112537 [Mycena amicta]
MSSLTASSFQSKIDSFFVPSEAEMLEIQSLLEGPTAELAKHDEEIADLEATLARRRAHREALRLDISLHESLLAPIRRVPQYILQEIFIACLPTEHNAIIHPSHPPLLFGRVCRYWRELSHGTPLLWSTLHLRGPQVGDSSYPDTAQPARSAGPSFHDAFFNVLKGWLSRTSDCTLSVSCTQPNRDSDHWIDSNRGMDNSTEVLESVLAFYDRIESLAIRGGVREWDLLLSLNAQKMPLKRIHLILDTSIKQPFESAAILHHPGLVSLSITGYGNPLALSCPWVNLSELNVASYRGRAVDGGALVLTSDGGLDQNGVYELLQRCPNLVRCELVITSSRPRHGSMAGLSMSSLEEFTLHIGYDDDERLAQVPPDIVGLFHVLSLPKLHVLQVGENHACWTFRRIPFSDIFREDLVVFLNPDWVQPATMIGILSELPRTTRLHLASRFPGPRSWSVNPWNPPLDDEFFASFATQNLCPLLRHLQIVGRITDSGMITFVRSRMPQIQSLELDVPSPAILDREALQELEQGGLVLHLRDVDPPPIRRWHYDPLYGL